jgi:hypothetical protein
MKKLLLALFCVALSSSIFAQKFSLTMEIKKVVYNGDSVSYEKPLIVSASGKKESSIVSVGKVLGKEMGVKFTFIPYELDGVKSKKAYSIIKTYYFKEGKDWKKGFEDEPIIAKSGKKVKGSSENTDLVLDEYLKVEYTILIRI